MNLTMRRNNTQRLQEEMEEHIALQTQENLRAGMTLTEARRQALLKLGAVEAVREHYHAEQTLPLVESLWEDLRYAVRQLVKSPAFTIAAFITFAVGIGVNTAIFSSMDAVVLHPLAVPRLDRVVTLSEERVKGGYEQAALANYEDWLRGSSSFEELAVRKEADMTLTGAGDAAHIEAAVTSASFFSVLRSTALFGRVYGPEESQPGRDAVAVLNYAFWQQHFGADPGVLGRKIELDQRSYTIIGVLPQSMQYPSTADFYLPFAPTPAQLSDRVERNYLVIGRLRDGVSVQQAQAELRTMAEHMAGAYPATNQGWTVHVESLLDGINGPYTPEYYRLLMGATLFLLLIVCANVANLQLARGVARRPEIAMRIALGATRWRILRQLLTENILLGLAGAVGGLAFGALFLHLTLITMPARVARYMSGWSNISLNGRVLFFSLLIAGLAGFIAGMAPAVDALRVNLVDQLKAGSRSSVGSGRTHRLRSIFAVVQISLAVALVIGAALISKGMNAWLHVADFYRPGTILTFNINLPKSRYGTPQKRAQWYDASLTRLRALPGVTQAELVSALPYDDNGWVRDVELENRPSVPGKLLSTLYLPVSAGYFDALHVPVVAGRVFNQGDSLSSLPVAIVSERFVAEHFPGQNPLGHRIRIGGRNSNEPWLTIAGVAKETNYSLWDSVQHTAVYVDAGQIPPASVTYAITATGDPLSVAPAARNALAGIDPAIPLDTVETYAQLLHDNLVGLAYVAALLGFDALFALFLAAIGIFAIMANLVSERTREFGLRIAMGARREDVLRMVLRRAGRLTAIGLGVGLPLAFALAHALAGMLHGVQPGDPLVFVLMALTILIVALAASWIPAWRAGRVDPMVALREE
ncbi:ABC transporter permease [Terracidiphilus gabretensis]|uniref:ABC transporter permease n=1 Tax=Terracidiphilus gabretensis TaxID=1577687 RepID=UPI00071B8CE9|nr:ABC transporter permease [Terracidiphilus gabretensis]